MKTTIYYSLILLALLALNGSCKKDSEPRDQVNCSGFRVNVSTWTNANNAIAETENGVAPINYQWSTGDQGYTIGGTTGTLQNGVYTVTATDSRGCTAQASITIPNGSGENIVVSSELQCVRDKVAYFTMGVYDGEGNSSTITIIDKGMCYSLNANPSISDQVSRRIVWGEYELSSLQLGTSYFVRAFAVTAEDTVYGQEHSITTNNTPAPYSIGQSFQGGIITYLSCDGMHGTIVLADDPIANYTANQGDAEDICNSVTQSGFDDWTLPNGKDFYFMNENLFKQGLGNFHTGNTVNDGYWSRYRRYDQEKCQGDISRYMNFQQDSIGEICTYYQLRVRPVRYF